MNLDRWNAFKQQLKQVHETRSPVPLNPKRFSEFVAEVPREDRIPLLLYAYDRYREISVCGDPSHKDVFESSCYSILISSILPSGITPTQDEALAVLRHSYHQCGHGCDVEPPLTFAEQAFHNRPYTKELFDAVAAYRETLRTTRSTVASNVKRKLNWVLWHDPRRIEKKCCTRQIQAALNAMDADQAFRWQWLLRNTAAGLNAAPGKAWLKEAKKRLSQIGPKEFLARIDEWFAFAPQPVQLTAAGSSMLRLLIWYGSLVDHELSLPVLTRVAHVNWVKREPAQKVITALAWLLNASKSRQFENEVDLICRAWSNDSAEVKRLETTWFPDRAAAREEKERETSKKRQEEQQVKLNAQLARLKDAIASLKERGILHPAHN